MGLERRQKLVTSAGITPSPGMLVEIPLCRLREVEPARRCQLAGLPVRLLGRERIDPIGQQPPSLQRPLPRLLQRELSR